MTDPQIAIVMLGIFIFMVMLGFPIAFTLIAMGLGFGDAVGAIEGFGILSMASIGPILAVLSMGVWVRWKVRRKHQAVDVLEMQLPEEVS